MKIQGVLILALSVASLAEADVSTRVCLADGATPLALADPNIPYVYRDIMVGTWLTIIVSSDRDGYFEGGLFIVGEDREHGVLSGRDFNDTTWDWEGSHLEAATKEATVYKQEDDFQSMLDLYAPRDAVAGDWFIIDYQATGVGYCSADFYECVSEEHCYLVCTHSFLHVPTRDFNEDTGVDFGDLAILGSYWQVADCVEPDWCQGTDLDSDGIVDVTDFASFAEYWLQTTGSHAGTPDSDDDARVDFAYYAVLASQWQRADCAEEPGWCRARDLDLDGTVNANDLMLACYNWLEITEWR